MTRAWGTVASTCAICRFRLVCSKLPPLHQLPRVGREEEDESNRISIAWVASVVLAIVGLVPFFTGGAGVIDPPLSKLYAPPLTGLYAPLVFVLPPWAAALFAASLVLVFVLVGGAVGFAGLSRPLLVIVLGAWVLDATGFWNVGLPVGRLVEAESVGDMFRLTAQNLHVEWLIGGSLLGWIMLLLVIALAIGMEIVLSRRRAGA